MKNKKGLYGLVAGVLLVGGIGVTAALNQPSQKTVATNKTKTSQVVTTTQQSTTGNGVVSELESRLNTEVTAETNVAELEQQLTTVTDDKTREALSKKLDEVKQQHAVKVEEKAKVEHAQPMPQPATVVKADEVSQPVEPTPSTPQPVETTTTRQTTQQTQTVPVVEVSGQSTQPIIQPTKQKTRISPLGNSGREFATMEEAEDWADEEQSKVKRGYIIDVVFYSDGSQMYTVDWYTN